MKITIEVAGWKIVLRLDAERVEERAALSSTSTRAPRKVVALGFRGSVNPW